LGLVALVALLGIAAAACGTLQPYALIVNGSRIPQRDVDNELKAIRGNGRYLDAIDPSRRQILGSGTGTFNADFTAFVLNQDLDYELVHQEVLKRKLKVTPADIDQAKGVVVQQVNGADTFNAFPKDAQLVPEFLQAAFSQPVGQVGQPVKSQFGYHIIKVTSRDVAPYDKAKAEVQKAMGQSGGQQLQQWLTDSLKKAKVKMNP